jgi:hypothetical protein
VGGLAAAAIALDPAQRLPLLNLALPALRALPAEAAARLAPLIDGLVEADRTTTTFEFVLRSIVRRRLRGPAARSARGAGYPALTPLMSDVVLLLSALARYGHAEAGAAEAAFAAGVRRLGREGPMLEPSACTGPALEAALERCARAVPAVQQRIVAALTACAAADGTISISEAELLRAMCDAMDCPMPPLG